MLVSVLVALSSSSSTLQSWDLIRKDKFGVNGCLLLWGTKDRVFGGCLRTRSMEVYKSWNLFNFEIERFKNKRIVIGVNGCAYGV